MAVNTPEERLLIALDMADVGEQMMRARLRRESPESSDAEIQREVDAWLRERPGALHGDCPGEPARRIFGTQG